VHENVCARALARGASVLLNKNRQARSRSRRRRRRRRRIKERRLGKEGEEGEKDAARSRTCAEQVFRLPSIMYASLRFP